MEEVTQKGAQLRRAQPTTMPDCASNCQPWRQRTKRNGLDCDKKQLILLHRSESTACFSLYEGLRRRCPVSWEILGP